MSPELGRIRKEEFVASSKDTYQNIRQKVSLQNYNISHGVHFASKPRNKNKTSRKEVLNKRFWEELIAYFPLIR
jgi:hypothetical protein